MHKIKLLMISFCLVLAMDFSIPSAFPSLSDNDSYLLGFEAFLKKGTVTKGQKRIILLGGSSIAWGVSAEKLSHELDVLTLNSGIHASTRYKNSFKLISDVVDKDNDLIVISPEYSTVSESDFLNRSKEFCYIETFVKNTYPIKCLGYNTNHLFTSVISLFRNQKLGLQREYTRSGFNEYGDYTHRIMGERNFSDVCVGWSINDLQKHYIPFFEKMVLEGYNIVYIPNFIPKTDCSDPGKVKIFHRILFEKFGISPFLKADLLFDKEYFFNTSYHLTLDGVDMKSEIFLTQLRHHLNSENP